MCVHVANCLDSHPAGTVSQNVRFNMSPHWETLLPTLFAGTSVSDFRSSRASKALAAVSGATGLPASNITATYYSTLSSRRRTLLQEVTATASGAATAAAAAAESSGTIATYKLTAADPGKLASAVLQAVQDGSLLRSLESQGLTAPGCAPGISLSAQDAEGSKQLQLLQPTLLAAAAAPRPGDGKAAADAVAGSSNSRAGMQPGVPATVQSGSSSSNSSDVGAIVGGVIGGVCGAAVLAGLAVVAAKRQRAQQRLPSSVVSSKAACSTIGVADSDAGSTISSSTSCGNFKSVDVVMHVIDEDAGQHSKGNAH